MKNSEEQNAQHLLKPNEETHKLKQFNSQISFLHEHSAITNEQEGEEIAQKMPQFLVMIQKIKFKFMARRLLNSTRSFMFKNILPQQLKQIDDKSYATESGKGKKRRRKKEWMLNASYDPRQSNSQMVKTTSNDGYEGGKLGMSMKFIYRNQFLQQFLKMVDRKISVLDPTSVEKIVWDVINVVMIFVYTIQIPLFVTFNEQRQWQFHWFLIISVPFFLVIDIILSINTGCYDKGRLIKKRINLLDINFTRQIIPDFLISMSYAVTLFIAADYPLRGITDPGSIVTRWRDILLLPLFWKLQEFGDIVEKLQGHSILSKKSRNIIGLIKLILTIVYIGHLLSCFWILIAELESSLGYSTWTKLKQFDSASWHQIYIDSFYFSTVTMITVGYGDFIPVNEAEKTICIVIMIFSCGVFAYSMNTVGAILESFNEDQVKKNLNMSIINAYMTRKNVSKLMKNQIREYLDYYWKEESERDQEAEEKIISQLSDQLKKGLLVESKNVVLKKSAIFRNNFSDAVKELIVPLIKEYRCSPQEMICVKGDPNDCSIYFIEKGSVEVIFESSDAKSNMVKSLACISTGDSFGEGSFFTGKRRSASIRSREFTTLLILNRAEFLKILVNYPDDYEKFCTIRDSLCFYDDFKQIGVSCLSCNSKMHQIANCNYLHFNANTPHLREMFAQPQKQERGQWCRQRNSRSSARLNVGIINKTATDYQVQHEDSIEYLDYGHLEESENDEDNSEQNDENVEQLLDLAENNKHSIPKNQIINEEEAEEDSISKRDKNQKDKEDIDSPTSKGSLKYSSDKTPKAAGSSEVTSIFQLDNSSKKQLGFTEMHQQYDNSMLSKGLFGMKNSKLLNRTDSLSPSSSSDLKKSKFLAYLSHSSNLGDSGGEFQRQKSGINIGKTYQKIMMVKALESGLKKKEAIKRSNQKLGTVAGKTLSPYSSYLPENPIPAKKINLGFLRGAGRKQSVNSDRKTTFLGKLHAGNPMSNIFGNPIIISEIRRPSVENRGSVGPIEFSAETNEQQLEEQYDEERTKIEKANKVEDDFDAMQNFMFYFPLNNFNYQLQLLQIPKEERRRIMIWNSYDSNSQIVIKNSSFRTKRREKKAPVLNLTVKRQSSNFLEKQPTRMQDKALTLKLLDSTNLKMKSNSSQKFAEISPQKQENTQNDGSIQQNKDRKRKESKTIVVPSAKPYRYSQRQSTVESGNQNNSSHIGNNTNQMVNIFIPIRTSSLLGGKPSAETSATITIHHNDLTDVRHISSVNCIPTEVNNNGQNENTKGNNPQLVEIEKQDSQILHQSNQSNNCITVDNLIPSNSNIREVKHQGDARSREVEYQFDDSLFSINDLPIVFKDYRDSSAAAYQQDNGYNITVQDSEITQDLGANKPNVENSYFQSVTSKRN